MRPEISIIVPVYNVEMYLQDCLNSILDQTFQNFELILINDGSTDQSPGICDIYSQKDTRIKVLHMEYGGVSAARNAGISLAQGEYIGFVDGDDRIAKEMYSQLLGLCKKTNSDIAVCKLGREIDGILINDDKKDISKELNHIEAMGELFKGVLYRFSLCNKLFKKSCFENVIFPEGRIHEDLSTTYKLFANSNKTIYTSYIGYIYVKRSNSILTSKFNEKRMDAFTGWDEIIPFMGREYPKLKNEVLSCFTYNCIDNVYLILKQVKEEVDKEEYLKIIQLHIKRHFNTIIKIKALSLKYKGLVTILNYNIRLLFLYVSLKKRE